MKRSKFLQVCLIFALILSSLGLLYPSIDKVQAQEISQNVLGNTTQLIQTENTQQINNVVLDQNAVELKTDSVSEIDLDQNLVLPNEVSPNESEGILNTGDYFAIDVIEDSEKKIASDVKQYDVDNTGAFNYRYNLDIPQGRNNFTPDLSLVYNNQNLEQGIFGDAWSMDIPTIERLNKRGLNNIYSDNSFSSSLSGELIYQNDGTYPYGTYLSRVEDGSNYKYEFLSDNSWLVVDKLGKQYFFGIDSSSKQDDPSQSTHIYRWWLSKILDTNDNHITFSYFKDSGQVYPDFIKYTNYQSQDGIFKLVFQRESKPDLIAINNFGFKLETKYRINRIDVLVDNEIVKYFSLNYNSDVRSHLGNVVVYNKNESGNFDSLPQTFFNWSTVTNNFQGDISNLFPESFVFSTGKSKRSIEFGDVNGDGWLDILRSNDGGGGEPSVNRVYINNGNNSGWTLDQTIGIPMSFTSYYGTADYGVRLADINGDGLVDIMQSRDAGGGESAINRVYINNSHGWTLSATYSLPVYFVSYGGSDYGVRLADMNGDGLIDVLRAQDGCSGNPSVRQVFLNNGSTWVYYNNNIPDFFTNCYGNIDYGTRLADVNGDGLDDFMRGMEGNYQNPTYNYLFINTGSDWLFESYALPELFTNYTGLVDNGTRLTDINGDGLVDVLRSRDGGSGEPLINRIYLKNYDNSGWSLAENYLVPGRFVTYTGTTDYGLRMIDVNSDNFSDVVTAREFDGNPRVINNNLQTKVNIEKIVNSNGSTFNLSYKPSSQYIDNNVNLNPESSQIVNTVEKIVIDDGLNNYSTTTYQFSGGDYYFASSTDRRFSGFSKVTKTNDLTKTIIYYHQGDDVDSSNGELSDSYAQIGKPFKKEIIDIATSELAEVDNLKWETFNLSNGRQLVLNTQSVKTNSLGQTDVSTAKQMIYDQDTGNLLTENDLGKVTVNISTGEITNQLTGDEKSTDYEYAENITENILAAPKNKEVSNIAEVKDQNLYYDNLPLGEVEKVNLTKEDYIDQDVEVNRNFNNYGLVFQEINPKGATTTIAYDADNLYPTSSTDPLNNVTYTEYNLLNGQVATSTAPNGLVTVNKYDAFGRLKELWHSNPDSPSTLLKKQEVSYQDTTLPRYKETKDYFNTNSYTISREYYDGLDRVIQKKAKMPTSGEYSTVDISYDSQGRVERQPLPYITSSIDYSTPNLSQPAKTYTYDALGRALTEVTPTGTTGYEYNGFTTKITDANGNFKELTKDAYGNLVEVKEYNGSNVYITTYEYTLTNKLKKITDSAGNIRNFNYDALDNLEWQDMVHKTSVTNPAKIQYTYDKNGNVLTETSFKNDAISYTYDDLNRPLTEKLSGVTKISYTYDQNSDIGQLTFADYGSGNSKAYDYDILGKLKIATTTIANEAFVMNYGYNLNGDLKEIVYPDNKVVSYSFNTTGQVDEVSLNQGQGANVLADNIEYNQNGQMTHVERANGVDTDYTYDPAESFRLTDMASSVATSTLHSIAYIYDNIGNITNITDDSDTDLAKSVDYYYDGLYRLATSTVSYVTHPSDNYTQTFTYDSIGNMIHNSDLGTMNYANGQPHQLSSYGTRTFTYDVAGNMKTNKINKFFWDWRNRLTNTYDIASENNTYYQYDHNNQRFIKWTEDYIFIPPDIEIESVVGGDIMQVDGLVGGEELDGAGHWEWQRITQDKYIEQYFEKGIVNDTKAHIYLGGIKLATVNNNDSPYFILGDHLGSSSILVSNAGAVAQLSDYQAFGKIKYENTIENFDNKYKFTDKILDPETNIQYFGARYMDNQIARFVSVDPILLKLSKNEIYNNLYESQYSGDDRFNNLLVNLKVSKNRRLDKQDMKDLAYYYYLSDPQQLNTYIYVTNNPIIGTDFNGKWEIHFSYSSRAGAGGSISNVHTFGIASDGTYGTSLGFNAGGFAGIEVSAGINIGYSSAVETWKDFGKDGYYVESGVDAGIVGIGAQASIGEEGGYEGADIGASLGVNPAPFSMGAGYNDEINTNVKGNITDIFRNTYSSIKDKFKNFSNLFR